MGLLDATMGATFIGVILAAVMYGVSCIQVYYYFCGFPNDRWHIKLLVSAVWLCDTVHQALISHTVYTYLVTNFADESILDRIVWSLIIEVLFNGFVALMVQSFYMLRIYRLSNRKIALTALVFVLVFGEFGCVIAYTAEAIHLKTFEQLDHLKALSMAVNGIAAAADIVIAATLCIMLNGSRTGFKRSDNMINKLIVFTVNTGLLTSVCAVLSLITIVVLPGTFIYICFFFSMGRLYSNSLLATLNARNSIREASVVEDVLPLSLRDIQHSTSMSGGHVNAGIAAWRSKGRESVDGDTLQTNANGIAIRIDTTQELTRDNCATIQAESLSTNTESPSLKTEI